MDVEWTGGGGAGGVGVGINIKTRLTRHPRFLRVHKSLLHIIIIFIAVVVIIAVHNTIAADAI